MSIFRNLSSAEVIFRELAGVHAADGNALIGVLQTMLGPLSVSVAFQDIVKGLKSAMARLLKKRYVVLDSGTDRLVLTDSLVNKLAMGTALNNTVVDSFRPAPMPIALSGRSPTVACMSEETQSRYAASCPELQCRCHVRCWLYWKSQSMLVVLGPL